MTRSSAASWAASLATIAGSIAIAACSGEGSEASSPERELRRNTQDMLDAVAPGNTEVWRRYLDDRMIHVDENGKVRSKKELLDEWQPLPPGLIGSSAVENFEISMHGITAFVTFEAQEKLDYHGQPIRSRFRVSDTWLKTAEGWRLIGEHIAAIQKDPPSIALTPRQLCEYSGEYALTTEIRVVIRCTAAGLEAQRADRPPVNLLPELLDVFFTPGQPRTRRIFQRDQKGAIVGFVDRREGEDVRWRKSS